MKQWSTKNKKKERKPHLWKKSKVYLSYYLFILLYKKCLKYLIHFQKTELMTKRNKSQEVMKKCKRQIKQKKKRQHLRNTSKKILVLWIFSNVLYHVWKVLLIYLIVLCYVLHVLWYLINVIRYILMICNYNIFHWIISQVILLKFFLLCYILNLF